MTLNVLYRSAPKACGLFLNHVRWSMYTSKFIEPVLDKEELNKKLDTDDERLFRPIKAALNEHTISCTYDPVVEKFIRMYNKEGKKELARTIMRKSIANLKMIQLEKYYKCSTDEEKELIELNPVDIIKQAIDNCKPLLITKTALRGGITYTVPIPVTPVFQQYKAIKWIIESVDDKDPTSRVWDVLPQELLEAYNNRGKSVRKKQELHKLCEANRAYAHYRW